MNPDAYVLVVLSAAAHAYWNFLLKRSGGTQAFIGISKIAEAAMLAPVVITGALIEPGRLLAVWWLPAVGAALVLLNYVLLTAAYRTGDLSLVYPLSRGAMLLFLPPIAFVTIGERLDPVGWAAITIIVAGIALLQAQRRGSLPAAATLYALLAAAVAAGYTVWDKQAVQVLPPLAYFAAYTLLVGVAYALVLQRTVSATEARKTWRDHRATILLVALLNSGSYLLALAALRSGKASYVIALRQLSIAGGAVLGWWLLGETIPVLRRAGIVLVLGGCVLLALAR